MFALLMPVYWLLISLAAYRAPGSSCATPTCGRRPSIAARRGARCAKSVLPQARASWLISRRTETRGPSRARPEKPDQNDPRLPQARHPVPRRHHPDGRRPGLQAAIDRWPALPTRAAVARIEARGLLSAGDRREARRGFVPIRKKGKLPWRRSGRSTPWNTASTSSRCTRMPSRGRAHPGRRPDRHRRHGGGGGQAGAPLRRRDRRRLLHHRPARSRRHQEAGSARHQDPRADGLRGALEEVATARCRSAAGRPATHRRLAQRPRRRWSVRRARERGSSSSTGRAALCGVVCARLFGVRSR